MHKSGVPAVDALRATVDRLTSRATVVADLDGSEHRIFPKALSQSESEAVRDWITRERAALTVEVGLGYGLSALHICEGLLLNGVPDAAHVVMDPFQRSGFSDCGLQVLGNAGVRHLVEYHPTSSQVLLPQFIDEGRSFDVAFADGNHRFDYVFVDLFYLGRLVKRGGITPPCSGRQRGPRSVTSGTSRISSAVGPRQRQQIRICTDSALLVPDHGDLAIVPGHPLPCRS